ncbi:MAG: hypothetical protein OWS74_03075 [Firmicutes bacterium]|nr:hypothetical protein [Bacillota bacterium]
MISGEWYYVKKQIEADIYEIENERGDQYIAEVCCKYCWDGNSTVISGVKIPIDTMPVEKIIEFLKKTTCL